MTTSGSVDFTSTRDEIIIDALTLCRAIDPEEPVSASQIQQSSRFLNRMIKTFQARGLALWLESEAILFINKGTRIYTFPGANAFDPEMVVNKTVDVFAPTGSASVDVTDTFGAVLGDIIGIELDDQTVHFATVDLIVGSLLWFSIVLPSDASVGNKVYLYTKKINRPLKILSARRTIKGIDSPLEIVSREEYVDLPNKAATGLINEVYYKPLRNTGELYVWPTGSSDGDLLSFTYQRPIEDFDLTNDNPDFPVEWHEMLVANLAYRLAPTYGVTPDIFQMIREQAQMTYSLVDGFDAESTSVYIGLR